MSTITLGSNAVMNREARSILKNRIINYFLRNQNTIVLGLCAISGKVPDLELLHAIKAF